MSPSLCEFEKDVAREKRFADAMSVFHQDPGFAPGILVDHYDFASFHHGVFVDIGGSLGFISIDIAKKHPSMQLVVQEHPEVVKEGKEQLPSELANRVTFMAHDFFTEQPVKNADVYYFRWIFHNWSDKYAVAILKNLIPTLKKGAEVVVSDLCLPPPGMLHAETERTLRIYDLCMMELQNGKEIDSGDWKQLFLDADKRFVFEGVTQPTGSALAIIEVRWDGDATSK
ncbi:hypothetical protein HYALB_00004105 [Hymenoscyphus albidus]|uniref:O-methyltransferase C-terminal domain-containing protein n=1 Tax=Hymenoscyphus albidus TaxID=595503 RepID=A0A9N9M1D6_9HELO|nr:hypothetical protein HYALB_00004105 [Hymenoscyphus albidus]